MSIDTVGNFLTILRNALMVHKRVVKAPYSKLNVNIAQVLKDEGFVRDFSKEDGADGWPKIVVFLKYVDGESVIHELTRKSTPGRRAYRGLKTLRPLLGGLGIAILSTNKGVISDRAARSQNVGGEVLCHVW